MPLPLLDLGHDWHRQRSQLRAGRQRPPPLVAAGIEVEWDAERGRQVRMGGMAVIFGHFPPSFADFAQLARARLHLAPGQARQLDPVLNTRVLALWAFLPELRSDCYIEYDRAADSLGCWLLGPGGEMEAMDEAEAAARLDERFLDALVLNGSGHWGGESGLIRLVERFGRRPLLVAAQVAEQLERHPRQPRRALVAAQALWPGLSAEREQPWAELAGSEPPWALVQLGRLALRLGLLRAARALLAANLAAEQAPVAHFDLGQACEALGDLAAAEQAFARFAAQRPHDPDAWRRLLFCRLRLDHLPVAEETLRRYRAGGGRDADLVERFLGVVARGRLPAEERVRLCAWLGARAGGDLAQAGALEEWAGDLARRHLGEAGAEAARDAVETLANGLVRDGVDDLDADLAARLVLLVLPVAAPPHRGDSPPEAAALHARARAVLAAWWGFAGREGAAPVPAAAALDGLCTLLVRRWGGDG